MVFTDETTCAVCLSTDMRLFKVVARAFLMKNERTQMAAPLRMRFVLHASLNVAGKLTTEIGSLELNKCAFICNLIFSASWNYVRRCSVVTSGAISEAIYTGVNCSAKMSF